MNYFWGLLGWIWSKRKFLFVALLSAILFFASLFPFSDLSDVVTSMVARGTGNQIYLQFDSIDLNLLPSPAVSAKNITVETSALPPLAAKWMKVSPSWTSFLMNIWTLKKASSGDAEAANKLPVRLGASISAEGLLGADVDLRVRPGSPSEQGSERSKVSLAVEKLNLTEFQKWSDLPMKLQGQAELDTTLQFVPGFVEQPEGEVTLRVVKFNLPATTLMIPFGGAMMPVNLPTLTLANASLKGHFVGGKFFIDEGTFGQNKDPIYGRIKGQMSVRLSAYGSQVQPQFGPYNLTVDLNASRAVEKEIGFAFLLFEPAKTATASGSRYLFQASGSSFGPPPQIARVNSF